MVHANESASLKEYILTENKEICDGVHLISFERKYDFLPGQVIKIATDISQPPRIYSICSGKNEPTISVLFNVKKEGLITPLLAKLSSGNKILASPPYGTFIGSNDPAWWIATGTGIAPFYSMLRSGQAKNKKLIHGARHLNEFYFKEVFEDQLGADYIRCCSREPSDETFHGRITNYLQKLESLPDVQYYLCGSAIMVVEVRDILISKGIPFTNIMSEIYF